MLPREGGLCTLRIWTSRSGHNVLPRGVPARQAGRRLAGRKKRNGSAYFESHITTRCVYNGWKARAQLVGSAVVPTGARGTEQLSLIMGTGKLSRFILYSKSKFLEYLYNGPGQCLVTYLEYP